MSDIERGSRASRARFDDDLLAPPRPAGFDSGVDVGDSGECVRRTDGGGSGQ